MCKGDDGELAAGPLECGPSHSLLAQRAVHAPTSLFTERGGAESGSLGDDDSATAGNGYIMSIHFVVL